MSYLKRTLLFTTVLKHSSSRCESTLFHTGLECLEYTCGISRGPEESFRLHSTASELFESLDEDVLSKEWLIERLLLRQFAPHCIIHVLTHTNNQYWAGWFIPETQKFLKFFKNAIFSTASRTKLFVFSPQLYHTHNGMFSRKFHCGECLRSIRRRTRLVGGQGEARKDEGMRPVEVIRRCCGSHEASRSPRSRRGRGRWTNQKTCTVITRAMFRKISDEFSTFTSCFYFVPICFEKNKPFFRFNNKRILKFLLWWR